MSWRIEIKPTAEKQYLRLDAKTRARVKRALRSLEREERPLLAPQLRALTGKLKGDCRLRVGELRVLMTADKKKKILYAYAIVGRGQAYK